MYNMATIREGRKRKCHILLADFLAVAEATGAVPEAMGLLLAPLIALPAPISQDLPAISITMAILGRTPFLLTSTLPLGEEKGLALI